MASNRLSLIVSFTGQDKLSGALKNLIGLGKNGDQALKGMTREAGRLRGSMKELEREIATAGDNVEPLIARQRELASELERVNARIAQQRRLNEYNARTAAIRQRGQELQGAGTQNVLAGAALAAPLVLAAKKAMEFSSGMVDIQQKAGLTNAETKQMAANIMAMAKAAHQLPEDMRTGVDTLSGMGIDPRQAMQMIGPIGRLGTAYKVELGEGSAAAAANLLNLKVGLQDTGKALDIMAAGGNVGAFEVKDMARYFPSLTAQAQALGQSGLGAVADLTAALEIARRGAGTSEEAGTNVANLLAKINSPATINAFKKNFGVDLPAALKAAYAKGKTPMEALAEITQKATGGDLSKLGMVVEDMQAQSALRTLILNMKDYKDIREKLKNSGGTVDQGFALREANDASIKWKDFNVQLSILATVVGTRLLPVFTPFLTMLTSAATGFADFSEAYPNLTNGLITLVTGFIAGKVAIGALQYGFGSLLTSFATARTAFNFLRPGFSMIYTMGWRLVPVIMQLGSALGTALPLAIRALTGDLLKVGSALFSLVRGAIALAVANPFIALAIGLGIAAYLIYANWDKIKAAFRAGWEYIKSVWAGAPAWLRNIGTMMMNGLLDGIPIVGLASRLLQVAKYGIKAFRDYLGIKSPSRLMMEMGGHIATGLGYGIDGGAHRPIRSMGRMAASVASAGALAMSGPSAQGKAIGRGVSAPITIHIHQQPGEDAHDLAKRVADIIERKFGGGGGDMGDDF